VSPIVTALREQPRGRVEIQLDGASWRLVPVDAVIRSGLCVGRALDRETARTLGRELRRADALARAARALRPRDRSRQALEDRLATAGVRAPARAQALETLERVGLVDDARMAEARAVALAGRGFGDAAIRYDLEREGIAPELVEQALSALEPERERAEALVTRRGAGVTTARWLAGKGFDAGTIEDALGGSEELGGFAGDV
jgi:SOS response regulatory protein OraA/RecX